MKINYLHLTVTTVTWLALFGISYYLTGRLKRNKYKKKLKSKDFGSALENYVGAKIPKQRLPYDAREILKNREKKR